MANLREIFELYKESNGGTIVLDGKGYSVKVLKKYSGLFLVSCDQQHCLLVTPEEELINYYKYDAYIKYVGTHGQFLLFRDFGHFFLYDIERKKYIFSRFTNNDQIDPQEPLGYYRYHTNNDSILHTNAFISYGVNPEDGKHYLFDSEFCENGEPLGPYDSIEWLNYYYSHKLRQTYLRKYFVFTQDGAKKIYCKGIGFIAEELYGNKIINITRPRGAHKNATGFGTRKLIITTKLETGEELQYLCEIETREWQDGSGERASGEEYVDFKKPQLVPTDNMKAQRINLCSADCELWSLTTDGVTAVRTQYGKLKFEYECEEIVALFGVVGCMTYYKFKKNGKWGILKHLGGNVECILAAEYDDISPGDKNFDKDKQIFVTKKGDKYGYFIIDGNTSLIVEPNYNRAPKAKEYYYKLKSNTYSFKIVTLPNGKKIIFGNETIKNILKEETGLDEFDEIEKTNSNFLLFYANDRETGTICLYVYDLNNQEPNLVTMPALTDGQKKLSEVPFTLKFQQSQYEVQYAPFGDLELKKACHGNRYCRKRTRKTE